MKVPKFGSHTQSLAAKPFCQRPDDVAWVVGIFGFLLASLDVDLLVSGVEEKPGHLRKMVPPGLEVWAVAWPNTRPSPPSHLVASRLAPPRPPSHFGSSKAPPGPRPGLAALLIPSARAPAQAGGGAPSHGKECHGRVGCWVWRRETIIKACFLPSKW